MKKKVIVGLVVVLLLAFTVPAMAALTADQKNELIDLYKQQAEIMKKIIDVRVKAGLITKEQGDFMKQRIDAMLQYRIQNPDAFGPGCGGFGRGGFWGRWNQQVPNNNNAVPQGFYGPRGGMMGGYSNL
ncbi:hypothetical protein ciss_11730 [Carboxydothermus islandicus]|uniref:DUF2680 domain-containing protein n=1 Tax=Carboxydothermus islandicus TaxID=661089 RepID=A0A1L8D241_9THEO|nr:YckD family protein [Carboxydothermus islandicus]GAV25240.1 hypothetical protein ciss_11730 [Carboxydothermus islandicus]